MLRTLPISIESLEAAVGRALRRAPVQNQLQLDVMQRVIGDPQRQPTAVHLVAVEDASSGDLGVAMQTPPRKVIEPDLRADRLPPRQRMRDGGVVRVAPPRRAIRVSPRVPRRDLRLAR